MPVVRRIMKTDMNEAAKWVAIVEQTDVGTVHSGCLKAPDAHAAIGHEGSQRNVVALAGLHIN